MKIGLCILAMSLLSACVQAGEPHPGAEAFVQKAVEEFGFDRDEVSSLLAEARFQQSIVDAMKRPAESKPWYEYRPIFLNDRRISEGVAFWKEHRELIEQVSAQFSVEPQFVVAIIGVETHYGRITGSYRVLDALATLGFHYPKELKRDRSAFFAGELLQFLQLGREENLPVTEITGSYAGAMGLGQFMPSSYRRYAVDFDGSGNRDLWQSLPDAVASVANYLHEHGWQPGEPVVARAVATGTADTAMVARGNYKPALSVAELAQKGFVSSPDLPADRLAALVELEEPERPTYWLGFDNFYVITRYNRSPLYAMAVAQLSDEILAGMSGP